MSCLVMNLVNVDELVDVNVLKPWFLKIIKLMSVLLKLCDAIKSDEKLRAWKKQKLAG